MDRQDVCGEIRRRPLDTDAAEQETQAEGGAIIELARAAGESRVDQHYAREVAPVQAAINAAAGRIRPTNGHPVEIRLRRRRDAIDVSAFALLVVLRAGGGSIVGDLMIVPHRCDRLDAAEFEQVGIGMVLAIATVIVVKRHDLARGIECATGHGESSAWIFIGPVLIDVVARVKHEIDICACGEMRIGVEVPEPVISAGDEADGE